MDGMRDPGSNGCESPPTTEKGCLLFPQRALGSQPRGSLAYVLEAHAIETYMVG